MTFKCQEHNRWWRHQFHRAEAHHGHQPECSRRRDTRWSSPPWRIRRFPSSASRSRTCGAGDLWRHCGAKLQDLKTLAMFKAISDRMVAQVVSRTSSDQKNPGSNTARSRAFEISTSYTFLFHYNICFYSTNYHPFRPLEERDTAYD